MVVALSYNMSSDLVTARSHKKLMRRLNREQMEFVRDKFLPKHFKRGPETRAGGAYGYTQRNRRYQTAKRKKVGHLNPLVFTGKLRDTIRGSVRITATANGARLRARGYFPLTAQRRNELEAVSPAEVRRLLRRIKDGYIRLAKTPEFRRKRKRRRSN